MQLCITPLEALKTTPRAGVQASFPLQAPLRLPSVPAAEPQDLAVPWSDPLIPSLHRVFYTVFYTANADSEHLRLARVRLTLRHTIHGPPP